MTRLDRARAGIARRRALAQAATGPRWSAFFGTVRLAGTEASLFLTTTAGDYGDASHVAANDPAHVLAVLAAADATLDRHARTHRCQPRWLTDDEVRPRGRPAARIPTTTTTSADAVAAPAHRLRDAVNDEPAPGRDGAR